MNTMNDLDTPTGQRQHKTFATLASQFAMQGHGLIKGDPAIDGQTPYYATHWRMVEPLADLDAARDYLAKLAGAGHEQELQAQ